MNVAKNYTENLVFQLLKNMTDVRLTLPADAQLIIKGPLKEKKRINRIKNKLASRKAIVLYDSAENTRHLDVKADYYITHDLGISDPQHLRVPHWYNVIDWQHEGIPQLGETTRYGRSISIEELMTPRSNAVFLEKEHSAAIFAGHLRQPRQAIIEAVKEHMPIVGYGGAFNKSILNHNESGIRKEEILRQHRFNICPENSLGIGYYTEKVVEAYAAGCLPIYFSDDNCRFDFNTKSFINVYKFFQEKRIAIDILQDHQALSTIYQEPLLTNSVKLDSLKFFIEEIINRSKNV